MKLDLFKKSLLESTIINKNNYNYLINPISDGIPEIDPKLLEELVDAIKEKIKNYNNFDKIITLEAMGIPLATLLSYKTNKPFTIIRKRPYFLKDEITVKQKTGYSTSTLYINGIKKQEKVIIIDDILSTGNSLTNVIKSLIKQDIEIVAIIVAIDKGIKAEIISKKFKIPVESLVKINIKNGIVKIL